MATRLDEHVKEASSTAPRIRDAGDDEAAMQRTIATTPPGAFLEILRLRWPSAFGKARPHLPVPRTAPRRVVTSTGTAGTPSPRRPTGGNTPAP